MEKRWDFDAIIDRRGTGSMKWDPAELELRFGTKDLLPLWVADMDFNCPPAVKEALARRLDHEIYGYTLLDPGYQNALIRWYEQRHQWSIDPEWLMTTPGVVPAVNFLIQRFSNPGDKILIQPPVYYPFAQSILAGGRRIQENPLRIVDQRYEMDVEDLEQKVADPRVKMAILCSPHNPVGRVWTREELETFGQICIQHQVLILADEIHCDLVMDGFCHTCFASINKTFAHRSITANAASKTFNLAGLEQSALVIPDPGLRQDFSIHLETLGIGPRGGGTLFGAIAARAAYEEGGAWLEELLTYIKGNFEYLKAAFEQHLPGVRVFDLEGTYLAWVDFTPLGHSSDQIVRIMEKKAGVALDHGEWFGREGRGFERFNLACPRSVLKKAVTAVITAFNS